MEPYYVTGFICSIWGFIVGFQDGSMVDGILTAIVWAIFSPIIIFIALINIISALFGG